MSKLERSQRSHRYGIRYELLLVPAMHAGRQTLNDPPSASAGAAAPKTATSAKLAPTITFFISVATTTRILSQRGLRCRQQILIVHSFLGTCCPSCASNACPYPSYAIVALQSPPYQLYMATSVLVTRLPSRVFLHRNRYVPEPTFSQVALVKPLRLNDADPTREALPFEMRNKLTVNEPSIGQLAVISIPTFLPSKYRSWKVCVLNKLSESPYQEREIGTTGFVREYETFAATPVLSTTLANATWGTEIKPNEKRITPNNIVTT